MNSSGSPACAMRPWSPQTGRPRMSFRCSIRNWPKSAFRTSPVQSIMSCGLRDQENALATSHFPDAVMAFFDVVLPAIEQEDSRILVHCHAGVSRSTAFAYGILAHRFGAGREDEAFAALRRSSTSPGRTAASSKFSMHTGSGTGGSLRLSTSCGQSTRSASTHGTGSTNGAG